MKRADNKSQSSQQPAGKAPAKAAAAPGQHTDSQRKKRHNHIGPLMFRSTIKRITRAISPDPIQLSTGSMEVLCGIAMALAEDISDEACNCSEKIQKQTLGADDILAAVDILYNGELKSQAVGEMRDALAKSSIKSTK